MATSKKMQSVLELAKYRPGDTPYWIITRPLGPDPTIDEKDAWAFTESVHPKTLYEYKILKGLWPAKIKLPKLHAGDFQLILDLLCCDLIIEKFEITNVTRCMNTGEFIYQNTTGEEWMPESLLFDHKTDAGRERDRIKKMLSKWANKKSRDKK